MTRKDELTAWEQEQEAAYNQRFSDLMKRENKLDVRIDAYKKEKEEFEEERNRGTLTEENEQLKNQVDQLSREKGQWNSQVQHLEDKIDTLEDALEGAHDTINNLRDEITSLKNIRDDLKTDLEKFRGYQ